MLPKIEFLNDEIIDRILDEAHQLLQNPGIKVHLKEARDLLYSNGAKVNEDDEIVHIPSPLAQRALESVPSQFSLFDKFGNPKVNYGGRSVQFDPGSSGVNILDSNSQIHRPALTQDLINIIKIADYYPQYDAQSTAVVCSEIPKEIGDLYRLYLVLLYSNKPIITGAFTAESGRLMYEMLEIFSGDKESLRDKPIAVFDVCPSPPLVWTDFGAQNLIDLARAGIPAELVSMPLSGAAAPITLLGSIVQHAAESISGITIHQLANPGSPIIWGGAPAIMDMRHGTTPMGAIETAMIDASYTQIGKYLGLPTHAYMGASDSKVVDTQAGLESGITTLIGALAGINMISGAGMLDFLACVSPEKLVIDAEAIGMAKRMIKGIEVQTATLATQMFEGINFKSNFLRQRITRDLVKKEQYIPSNIIDRGSLRSWQQSGGNDTYLRAKAQVQEILKNYQPPDIPTIEATELKTFVQKAALKAGMQRLPEIDWWNS